MVEQVGVEPTMFTTRERIYSPLQNTPYLQLLHDISLVLSCLFVNNVASTDERVAVISDSVSRTLTVE